jgi:signal peptide peptidase SppA
MRLADIVSAPWAITPEMFNEVQGIYARHCRGEKIDLESIEAKVGAPLNNARAPLEITDGVAVISIEGVIAKRANLFMRISGGTSTQIAGQQFAQALADPQVTAIVLAIDSPGGTVDGTQALSDQIFAARGQKPICAIADGLMASAAYWIGSAADEVYITGDTTMVGSIGVMTTHVDESAADMAAGVRKTEIKAGKYKQMGSSNAPLGMAEKDALQGFVDQTYQVFLTAVARNRGVSMDTVKSDMAEGRMFLGQKAIDAGLVDGVATLSQVCAELAALPSGMAGRAGVAQQKISLTSGVDSMDKLTVDSVKAQSPDVAQALIDEGYAKGRASGLTEGQQAETARIASLDALIEPGNEKLIAQYKADGKTSGPDAAYKISILNRDARATRLADMRTDAGDALAASPATVTDQPPKEGAKKPMDPHVAAKLAQAYKTQQAALGIEVSDAEAVQHVWKET